MRWLVLLLCFIGTSAPAATPTEILALNTRAMIYLEVNDAAGKFIDSGTGFIVSHNGFVVTAAHVKPAEGQKLWGVIGQRQGTRFILEPREVDEVNDVALWQLPQSAACHYAVTLATAVVESTNRVVALGFPGRDGLSPAVLNITNPSNDQGFYKSDGFVRSGYSGGPVFNEEGRVVATVHSGTPSGGNNELVPIAAAIALIKKRGVRAGIDTDQPFENSCFAFCRNETHGVEKWSIERPWQANSGEVPGGHNRTDECKKLMSAALVGQPDARIELLPGEGDPSKGMWEEVKTSFPGQVHYKYFCQGTYRSGPIFKRMQSPACGLWE